MCASAADNLIHIFDCGPNHICFDGDDFEIATAMKDANGNFTAFFAIPLKAGQIIYAVDACFDPVRMGPITIVFGPIPVPLVSGGPMIVLISLLVLVGFLGSRRGRRGIGSAASLVVGFLRTGLSPVWTMTRTTPRSSGSGAPSTS